jgi:biotin carboxyl carrier protein
LEAATQTWLSRQCSLIDGIATGVVLLGAPDNGDFVSVACWPAGSQPSESLVAAAKIAMKRNMPILKRADSASGTTRQPLVDTLAYPLVIRKQLVGIMAVEIEADSEIRKHEAMQLLKWGGTWLEMLIEQETDASHQQLDAALAVVALSLEDTGFQQTATALATRLAVEMACDRVSIGFLRGRYMTVRALSHSARHGVRSNLLRDIAAAMEESVDQDSVLLLPGNGQIDRAHKALAKRNGGGAICTIPLASNGESIGAITFERHNGPAFDPGAVELYKNIGMLIGPVLELKHRNDRWLIFKLGESLHGLLQKLLGPAHVTLKLATVSLSALVLFLAVTQGQYRITADAALEGEVQRAVVAPIDGFIATSAVRAGDIVQQGQLMGSLDDKDLQLERQKLDSEKARHKREYRNAMAEHDRAQVSILSARIAQAEAQIRLIDEQLARMQISAPLTGVVVSGDLSQSLDAPVERGDVLFEVAPLDAYRLVLQVDERDLTDVAVGQQGKLKLSGIPGEALEFTVENITPVAENEEGSNFFRIEAGLHDAPDLLRPGMEGIGKIEVETRKLLWIWTHRLVDWMKLWAWSWWP